MFTYLFIGWLTPCPPKSLRVFLALIFIPSFKRFNAAFSSRCKDKEHFSQSYCLCESFNSSFTLPQLEHSPNFLKIILVVPYYLVAIQVLYEVGMQGNILHPSFEGSRYVMIFPVEDICFSFFYFSVHSFSTSAIYSLAIQVLCFKWYCPL